MQAFSTAEPDFPKIHFNDLSVPKEAVFFYYIRIGVYIDRALRNVRFLTLISLFLA